MRASATAWLLSVLTVSVFTDPATSCVELQGIVPGGGEGVLDLTFLLSNDSIGTHPLAPLDTIIDPPATPFVSGVTNAALFVDLVVWSMATVADC